MTSDSSELPASHEDRDRVVETLRVAGGDGRLTSEELESRLETALSARTLGELAALTTDLPTGAPTGAPTAPAAKDVLVIKQTGSSYGRTGHWVVPKRIELRTQLCQVTFSKLKLRSDSPGTDPRLRIELAGRVLHAKIIERRPRRR